MHKLCMKKMQLVLVQCNHFCVWPSECLNGLTAWLYGNMYAPVYFRLKCTIANKCLLGCLQSGNWHWYSFNIAFPSLKLYVKCILVYSTLVNHTISFSCCLYLSIRSNVNHNRMQYELHFVTWWRFDHNDMQKNWDKVWNSITLKCWQIEYLCVSAENENYLSNLPNFGHRTWLFRIVLIYFFWCKITDG
jgi:hypothetical protein